MQQEKPANLVFPIFSKTINLVINDNLDGSEGENRETNSKCQINANNDYQAICQWLEQYKANVVTYKNYRKEAERLLFWCILHKKKALSSLRLDDFKEYFAFLQNPPTNWCSFGAKYHRSNPNWKPLAKPLTNKSLLIAISIIKSLVNYLCAANYLAFNPLSLIRNAKNNYTATEENKLNVQARILTEQEWNLFKDSLLRLPENTKQQQAHKVRLRFIIAILFLLGLRLNELATHTWQAFRLCNDQWWFYVKGKGNKLSTIPVNNSLLSEIEHYRKYFGITEEIQMSTFPIVFSSGMTKALSARQIYRIIKKFAISVASECVSANSKAKFLKFSPHWLRHLSATWQDKSGILFKHIRANHRHENDNTTRIYVHSIEQERHQDSQKLELFTSY